MNIGLMGGFAGGLAGGYFKSREDQRERDKLKLLQQLAARQQDMYDRGKKQAAAAADALRVKQAGAAAPASAPSAVQPNQGLQPGDPQNGNFDANANIGSNAHTAQMIASLGGPDFHQLASAIDPQFAPPTQVSDWAPDEAAGPSAGLDAGALGGAMGGSV